MCSEGYPGNYPKGRTINGLDDVAEITDIKVFHCGTKMVDGRVVTEGGRVLCVTALGTDLAEAKRRAYEGVSKISFLGGFYRRDIADKAIRRELTTRLREGGDPGAMGLPKT
jgi:phosphoribosylamine--glycine ligase